MLKSILVIILSLRYRLTINGAEKVPETGPVLLLGNHISWVDFIFIQWAIRRKIYFVMHAKYYELPVLRFIFKFLPIIKIRPNNSRSALKNIIKALENNKVVCIFPEGGISKDGKLAQLMGGFEVVIANTDFKIAVIPFAIKNMWGDFLSFAPKSVIKVQLSFRRAVEINFGNAIDSNFSRETVADAILKMLK